MDSKIAHFGAAVAPAGRKELLDVSAREYERTLDAEAVSKLSPMNGQLAVLGLNFPFYLHKCASRHNGVHFFDISTSQSAPKLRCFVHFHLEMCFELQRRAFFSSLIWPAGSAPAALARLLFDPPEPQIIGKI